MRGWLLGLCMITACYSPVIAVGVPCPDGECPDGQACVAGFCGAPASASGGASDAGIAVDSGLDAMASCPGASSSDVANEDGDKLVDRCDLCPTVADDSNADTDGDGVGDVCDPNPTTKGDSVALFEGFNQGIPAWAHSTGWTADPGAGAVRVAATGDANPEFLAPPITNPDHLTVSAGFTITDLPSAPAHFVDLSMPYDPSVMDGIDCELGQDQGDTTATGRSLSLYDFLGNNSTISSKPFAWATGTTYTMTFNRRGTSYTCNVRDAAGNTATVTSTTSSGSRSSAAPGVAVLVYAMTVRVDWLFVVRSP